MPQARCPDDEFIRLFESIGPNELAKKFDLDRTEVFERRRRIERRMGIQVTSPNARPPEHDGRIHFEVKNGTVLVGSDAHYWPDIVTTAHRAFVRFCKELKPKLVVMNGDILDGASISRHPPIGWEDRPTLIQEIEASQERLEEIRRASETADHAWPLGNHDARFSTRLATVAPEYARVHGTKLRDHFPEWTPCWSVWVNNSVVIKHRGKGGIHAVHNNAVQSGMSMITGHLHSLKVTPWTDYTGTRFGGDTGTLAAPFGPQFNAYMEDGPRNWRSGFMVLTFDNGRLLWPSVANVLDEEAGEIEFERKVYRV